MPVRWPRISASHSTSSQSSGARSFEKTLRAPFRRPRQDVTEENIQARVRGNILMAFSNKFGHLLLTTGNKSEIAIGYCTLYGDMCGGLAVITDVPKTIVYELSARINQRAPAGKSSRRTAIVKPPSAELRPNQDGSGFAAALRNARCHSAPLCRGGTINRREIIAEGYDAANGLRIIRLIDRSEYKRRQAAPGLKVTSRAFGFGRRMPIAQRYDPTASC